MTELAPQLLFVGGRESLVGAALSSKRVIGASSKRSDRLVAAETVDLLPICLGPVSRPGHCRDSCVAHPLLKISDLL